MRPSPCGLPPLLSLRPRSPNALTNDEAAEYLRLSPRTLEKQRVIGGGPKFRKFGRRVMRSKRPRCLGRPAQLRGYIRPGIRRTPRG